MTITIIIIIMINKDPTVRSSVVKIPDKDFYQRMMFIGMISGCHQIADRSFSVKGKQFPVCARCTGVLIGNIGAFLIFFVYPLPILFCLVGCAIMFADWLIQYLNIRESTNVRRLITGVIGGYSLTTLYCTGIKHLIQFFSFL
jgi:uncharacterized membrane protein